MNFILFDEPVIRQNLLPFTFTRPVADIRAGILTIAEKWAHYSQKPVSFLTQSYLQTKFPAEATDENIYLNGGVFPDELLVSEFDIDMIEEVRSVWQFFRDRRPETYDKLVEL